MPDPTNTVLDILSALSTRLAGITTDDDYRQTIKTVKTMYPRAFDVDDLPGINIKYKSDVFLMPGAPAFNTGRDIHQLFVELEFAVAAGIDSWQSAIDLTLDVIQAIGTDAQYDGKAIWTYPIGSQLIIQEQVGETATPKATLKVVSGGIIRLRIDYETAKFQSSV